MAKTMTVEVDQKGRVQIPASVRREIKSRRLKLSFEDGKILMEPVKSPETVRGKYKGLVRVSVERLEEDQERYLAAGRR